MTVVVIVIFDRRSDRIFPFQQFRNLREPFAREKVLELMVGFLGKWYIPGNRCNCPTYLFQWARLASMLTIEPTVPGNRLGLENTHLLRDSNDIYILCGNTRIRHDLMDSLPRHATCHFHSAEPLFGNSRENFPIV